MCRSGRMAILLMLRCYFAGLRRVPWLPLLLGEFVATDPTPEQDWQQVR